MNATTVRKTLTTAVAIALLVTGLSWAQANSEAQNHRYDSNFSQLIGNVQG